MDHDRIDEGAARAADLIAAGSTPLGLVAAVGLDHYRSIWARDAAITGLGALAAHPEAFLDVVGLTLDTLGSRAADHGAIPDVVWPGGDAWDWGEAGAVDASAWFVILAGAWIEAGGDAAFVTRWEAAVAGALRFLRHQDVTGTRILSAAPATDWMDGGLVRDGRTLHLNVLHHWAVATAEAHGWATPWTAEDLAERIRVVFWPDPDDELHRLYRHHPGWQGPFGHAASIASHARRRSEPRRAYASHMVHAAYGEHVDVAANLLAVISGLADPHRGDTLLTTLDDLGVAAPVPSRTFPEPIPADEPLGMRRLAVDAELDPRWRNDPHRYHNAAAWPWIGGFHVAALAKTGRVEAAHRMLGALADAVAMGEWGFHEWYHGRDGSPGGAPGQLWSAGGLLYGYAALHRDRPGGE